MFIKPNIVHSPSIYWESFKQLYSDLEESFRFVNPISDHFRVHSLRYYELLLRASTEFESLCKEMVINYKLSNSDPKDMRLKHFYLLNAHFKNRLSNFKVGFIFPTPIFITPLEEWSNAHSLTWYAAYNKVKHNKADQIVLANLENVLMSIAGLFVMIERCEICPRGDLSFIRFGDRSIKVISHDDWPVVLWKDEN